MNIQKNYILINIDETKIITRLLDGDFINYKQVVPVNTNTVVTISKNYVLPKNYMNISHRGSVSQKI